MADDQSLLLNLTEFRLAWHINMLDKYFRKFAKKINPKVSPLQESSGGADRDVNKTVFVAF